MIKIKFNLIYPRLFSGIDYIYKLYNISTVEFRVNTLKKAFPKAIFVKNQITLWK